VVGSGQVTAVSSYAYASNRPTAMTDLTGMEPYPHTWRSRRPGRRATVRDAACGGEEGGGRGGGVRRARPTARGCRPASWRPVTCWLTPTAHQSQSRRSSTARCSRRSTTSRSKPTTTTSLPRAVARWSRITKARRMPCAVLEATPRREACARVTSTSRCIVRLSGVTAPTS
jgi:hypothetical protein